MHNVCMFHVVVVICVCVGGGGGGGVPECEVCIDACQAYWVEV